MKKIIIIVFLSSSACLFSQPGSFGGHDSLLFDGAIGSAFNVYKTGCYVMVTDAKGKVMGSKLNVKMTETCGVFDTSETYKWDDISEPDLTKVGDSIVTGSDGYVTLLVVERTSMPELGDYTRRNTITMAPNSKLVIKDCDPYSIANLFNGKTYIQGKREGSMKFNVKTDISLSEPQGTRYSVEKSSAGDIIRVYEGSVEITMVNPDKKNITDAGAEINKLNEDFKNGKITQEEYIKKALEYSEKLNKKDGKDIKLKVKVEAGSQVTVGAVMGDVIPIENDDKWWDK